MQRGYRTMTSYDSYTCPECGEEIKVKDPRCPECKILFDWES